MFFIFCIHINGVISLHVYIFFLTLYNIVICCRYNYIFYIYFINDLNRILSVITKSEVVMNKKLTKLLCLLGVLWLFVFTETNASAQINRLQINNSPTPQSSVWWIVPAAILAVSVLITAYHFFVKSKNAFAKQKELKYQRFFKNAAFGVGFFSTAGELLEYNETFESMVGLNLKQAVGKRLNDVLEVKTDPAQIEEFLKAIKSDETVTLERNYPWQPDKWLVESYKKVHFSDSHEPVIQVTVLDITERVQSEKLSRMTADILYLLNQQLDINEIIHKLLITLQEGTGFDRLAFRLRNGDDFPIVDSIGFSEEFIKKESPIISRNPDGSIMRNAQGEVLYDCTCGSVIAGRDNKFNPYYTENGSFWTNIEARPKQERDERRNVRHDCNFDFTSAIALVPIRIYPNTKAEGVLIMSGTGKTISYDMILFLERIANSFGVALQRKQSHDRLMESEKQFRFLFENAGVGITYVKPDGTLVNYNKMAEAQINTDLSKCLNKDIHEVFDAQESAVYMERINRAITSGAEFTYEDRIKNTPKQQWVSRSISAMRNSRGSITGVQIITQDITERKIREQEIQHINSHDSLTGLYNRQYFESKSKEFDALDYLPLSVISGDINGLKLANDVFGHATGDMLLKQVADVLRQCCRETDIVARVGGDEFAVLLPKMDKASVIDICARIYYTCEALDFRQEHNTFKPSISLGYATKTSISESLAAAIKSADEMMYKRKLFESRSLHSSLINTIKTTVLEKKQRDKAACRQIIETYPGNRNSTGFTSKSALRA